MKIFELDPEVLADMRLRDATARDRSRTRGDGVYDWRPAPAVAHWPCRNTKCAAPCEATQDAVDNLAMFNRELAKRGERPIATSDVMVCTACRKLVAEAHERKARRVADDMAIALKRLRASNNPESETELIRMLEACRYSDVPTAIRAMRASIEAKKSKPGRMGAV